MTSGTHPGTFFIAGSRERRSGYNLARVHGRRGLKEPGQRVDEEDRMEQPNVSIEFSIKIVDSNHYEFTTPLAVLSQAEDDRTNDHGRAVIVQGTSSVIGPGLSVPVA